MSDAENIFVGVWGFRNGNPVFPGGGGGGGGAPSSEVINAGLSTGVVTGGVMTVGAGADEFSISDGFGYVVDNTTDPDNPTITKVTWTGLSNITVTGIGAQLITFVSINAAGVVIQQATRWTPAQGRDGLILGVVVHVDLVNVDATNNEQHVAINVAPQLGDLFDGLGFINVSGNVYGPNGANLELDKTIGVMMNYGINWDIDPKNPNQRQLAQLTGLTFQYRFQNGTNGATGTVIDPNIYDVGGVSTPVPANRVSVQRIYSFTSNNVKIQPGQATYNNQNQARQRFATEAFVTEPSIAANGLLRGFLIVDQGATDLSDASEALFIPAGKLGEVFGGGGGGVGVGDVIGPASSNDDRLALFDGITGKLLKEGTVTGTAVAAHLVNTFNPHDTSLNNLGGSNLAALNALVSDATLDTNTASRPPNGTAGGSLNGSYPNPGVDDGADGTAIHDNIPGEIIAIPVKAMPVGTDVLVIEDSAAADAKKHIRIGDLPAAAPAVHAIDGAAHSFPGGGGNTYLDDDGNFSTPPAGTGDVIQVGAPVEDESVAVYDDTTGKKIKGGGPVATSIVTRSTTTSEIDEVPVFTDTASKVITGSGIKFINGALCVKQVNGEAFALALGDLIAKSSVVAGEVLLTSGTTDNRVLGPVAIGGAAGADVWIAILGEATVKCDLSSVLLTGFLDASPTPGRAHTHASPTDLVFGMPVTTKGPAVLGTVRCMMVPREYF